MIRYFQYGKFHCLQYIGHAKKLKSDCKDAIYSEQNILRFLYFFAASCQRLFQKTFGYFDTLGSFYFLIQKKAKYVSVNFGFHWISIIPIILFWFNKVARTSNMGFSKSKQYLRKESQEKKMYLKKSLTVQSKPQTLYSRSQLQSSDFFSEIYFPPY